MINIKLQTNPIKAFVTKDGKGVKSVELSKAEYGETVRELCEDEEMLDALRVCNKLFKPTSMEFIDVKE